MHARLIASGTRLPEWVNRGYAEYSGRLGAGLRLQLVEIPLPRRSGRADVARARAAEGDSMLAVIEPKNFVVALDAAGRSMTSPELARWLEARLASGRDLVFAIGGPDGLAPQVLARADYRWSLSALTWPHGLVRVMLAEQLYRAQSLLKGHPYHRA